MSLNYFQEERKKKYWHGEDRSGSYQLFTVTDKKILFLEGDLNLFFGRGEFYPLFSLLVTDFTVFCFKYVII